MTHPYYKKRESSPFIKFLPIGITLSLFICLGIFIIWLSTVLLPVVSVELSYQSKKTMVVLFGFSDVRALFLPQFRVGVAQTSKHPEGAIVIPSLFMDEPVIYNVDPNNVEVYTQALKKGIAHASSTRLPDTGGLGYYFAHSSSPSLARQFNAVFYLLGKLNGDEKISLWHEGKRFDYKVVRKEISVPENVSFLTSSYDKETIVLQTCWPPGVSERRLLVYGERVN